MSVMSHAYYLCLLPAALYDFAYTCTYAVPGSKVVVVFSYCIHACTVRYHCMLQLLISVPASVAILSPVQSSLIASSVKTSAAYTAH